MPGAAHLGLDVSVTIDDVCAAVREKTGYSADSIRAGTLHPCPVELGAV